MTSLISAQLDNYMNNLARFRNAYFVAREKYSSRNSRELNLAEFAILHSRGGRRLPLWVRTIELSSSLECVITKHELRDFYDHLVEQIGKYKIVPKTRVEILASYLAGQISAGVTTLADYAGIGTSTARNWLRNCAEHEILEPFHTFHESYFLNVNLIGLVIDGNQKISDYFAANFARDLASLRKRKDWLNESQLGYFYGSPEPVF